jgi:protein TonB
MTFLTIKAQENQINDSVSNFLNPEIMPSFIGGDEGLLKFLNKEIRYPKKMRRKGITGTVYVYFIIGKEGQVEEASVKKGVSGGEELNQEALRVINKMPKWNPGSIKGVPVRVQFTLPIKFKLT